MFDDVGLLLFVQLSARLNDDVAQAQVCPSVVSATFPTTTLELRTSFRRRFESNQGDGTHLYTEDGCFSFGDVIFNIQLGVLFAGVSALWTARQVYAAVYDRTCLIEIVAA
jgi:hypothetical protein